jgi:release factor glutamine methyltransferase
MEVSIKQALQEAASFLRQKGVPSPRAEAEIMLAFLLRQDRTHLYAYGEQNLTPAEKAAFGEMLQRRSARIPLAYITGKKEFMGLTFSVNENVLIPRPETEHLVEAVIKWGQKMFAQTEKKALLQILDLGTGCGNIAIALAYYLPFSFVTGVDLDQKALQLAYQNAEDTGVAGRTRFLCGSYWEPLTPEQYKFDIVVSNPPYIPRGELSLLPPEVQSEPRLALNGGPDGLDAYRSILGRIQMFLNVPGLLALEIGQNQAERLLKISSRFAFFKETHIIKDYAGIERVLLFST